MAERALPTALVGCGRWGQLLAADTVGLPILQLVTVCDPRASRAEVARRMSHAAAAVTDYHRVLDDPRVAAVIVATPTHHHLAIVREALAAGKHVYCEAPLAASAAECRVMARLARTAQTLFVPGLQSALHPLAATLRSVGRNGRVLTATASVGLERPAYTMAPARLAWRSVMGSAGMIAELAVGQVDLALGTVLRRGPLQIIALGRNLDADGGWQVPDTVDVLLHAGDGSLAMLHASGLGVGIGFEEHLRGRTHAVTVHGGVAMVSQEFDRPAMGWEAYQPHAVLSWGQCSVLTASPNHEGPRGRALPLGEITPRRAALQQFAAAAVQDENTLPPTLVDRALAATLLALRIHEASLTNATITVHPEDLT